MIDKDETKIDAKSKNSAVTEKSGSAELHQVFVHQSRPMPQMLRRIVRILEEGRGLDSGDEKIEYSGLTKVKSEASNEKPNKKHGVLTLDEWVDEFFDTPPTTRTTAVAARPKFGWEQGSGIGLGHVAGHSMLLPHMMLRLQEKMFQDRYRYWDQ